jgi:capsular exopolysaccharide synthesis family protein
MAQQRRIDDLRRGIRELRQSVSRMRETQDLYSDPDDMPAGEGAVPPYDHEPTRTQSDQPSRLPVLGKSRAPRDETDNTSNLAVSLQNNLTTFQRAIERIGGRAGTEVPSASGGSLGGPMEVLTYWKIIRKRLWLLVLLMIVGGAATGYYVAQQPSVYRSTTTLYLNPAAASSVINYASYDGLEALASTYTEFMKTRSFASRVSRELNGAVSEGQVIEAISTQYVVNTQFYRITATYIDPQLTQQLANTAAQALIAENIARQQAEQDQRQTQSQPDPERDRLVQVRTNLQQELDLYNGQIATLQSQLDRLKAASQSDANDKQILDMQQQLINVHSLRTGVMSSLADTQATLISTSDMTQPTLDTAVVVDVAPLPEAPLPANLILQILIALLVSLSIGAAIAFLLEYLDYTVRTAEAMESVYGMPVQGVIGLAKKHGRGRGPGELVAIDAPHSPIAESFRALRTGVHVAGLVSPIRKLMVTSARPSEGKTFVAANLAISLAQTGARVILVDVDLRKPSQHYLFDMMLDPGFTNLVIDPHTQIDDVLQPTSVANLQVMTCGIIPPNPAELIGSQRAAEVIEQLAQQADIVIFDTPPAATVTDALVIAPRVDAVLQVVLSGATRIDVVRRCKTLLERSGARLLGPVLNQVPLADMTSYEYYYSSGYYRPQRRGRRKGHKSRKQTTAPLLPAEAKATNGNGAHGSASGRNGNGHISTNGAHDRAASTGTK